MAAAGAAGDGEVPVVGKGVADEHGAEEGGGADEGHEDDSEFGDEADGCDGKDFGVEEEDGYFGGGEGEVPEDFYCEEGLLFEE